MSRCVDVIVVGGGHAGIEAALAASRMGMKTVMVTARKERIGEMSCNPAIGGIAKGTIVREVDALDGSMAVAADETSLQFRMLNRRKGPAVWGPRVQSDAMMYARAQQRTLEAGAVEVIEDEVTGLIGRTERIEGVQCRRNGPLKGRAVVLATGTFLGGMLFRGEETWRGGRTGDISADRLDEDLRRRMFHVERFKTGTPPRILRDSIDTGSMEEETSEEIGFSFSYSGSRLSELREFFYTVHTNRDTAEAAKDFLHRSPLLAGRIEGKGPRYCPSFEDKVVKFPERAEHRIYVEPMGYRSRLLYLNGLSSSLPREAQYRMVRTLPGFHDAVIHRFGYAVEYSYISHEEIAPTLRLRRTENLFAAGQVCGTSGYEEAAGLGVLAGINAARQCLDREGLVLSRMDSYIGVMVDDIIGRGVDEPYRMFSSRAENRLYLRQDNADRRMLPAALGSGVLSEGKKKVLEGRTEAAGRIRTAIDETSMDGVPAGILCRRGELNPLELLSTSGLQGSVELSLAESVILDEKYQGYIQRNLRKHRERSSESSVTLSSIDSFMDIEEICWEAREVLERRRPETLQQARNLPGVRPTDINGLIIHLGRKCSTWNNRT
ncbi:MAG: hypothetical protein AVO35_01520 [Candidatus Aegiribacteria sp. MLS_C]|nr:MAG: hypothetical protein AVO35_01520 [Candidatus Aegiribacteria sp. MLS_C]